MSELVETPTPSGIKARLRETSRTRISFYILERNLRIHLTYARTHLKSRIVKTTERRDVQFHGLSLIEHSIASAVGLGLTNDEIALHRGTSKRTVDRQVANILGKLELTNRAQIATFIAVHSGWVFPLPSSSALVSNLPELWILGGDDTVPRYVDRHTAEAPEQTLHVGSLLSGCSDRRRESLMMSRGEDLAISENHRHESASRSMPVRISRFFAERQNIDDAMREINNSGIDALILGNFDTKDAKHILSYKESLGVPILHSMVSWEVSASHEPRDLDNNVFQMCADESVYLQAFASLRTVIAPDSQRIVIAVRGMSSEDIVATIQKFDEYISADDIHVINFDEQDDAASIALEIYGLNPDYLYLGMFSESLLSALLDKLMKLQIDCIRFAVWVPGFEGFIERNRKTSEGLVWSTLVGNTTDHFGKHFESAYQRMFRTSPGTGPAAVHYDMIYLLRRAWMESGEVRSSIGLKDALKSVHFTGVNGAYHFDQGRRRPLCFPFETNDSGIGQTCLTFQINNGESVPIALPQSITSR